MAAAKLEERLTAVENEVERLKEQLANSRSRNEIPWFERIFGTFKDDPDYDEAMRLGKEYRLSQRPDYEKDKDTV